MKQLLILFFLLVSITASAQVDTLKQRQFINAYGYQYKNAAIDSSLRIPRDTFKLRKADSGSIAYKSGQTWIWNGTTWILSSGSGSGGIGTATAPIAITGSNVAINYKTDGLQVEGTSLAAKSKVFKTQAELRALTLLDTGVVYMTVIGKRVLPFVYSSTEAAPDDSARVIVTAGGKLVQDLGGVLTPEQFGAIGDGVTSDDWAFQKISNYIGTKSGTIECNGRATYKFSQAVTIQGAIGNLEQFIVNGNGAIFTGARIFQRRPTDNTAAINETSRRIIIKHCNFRSTTSTGSLCLEIGGTYSSVVANNTFQNYDSAVAFKFGLSSRSEMNQYVANKNALLFMNGDWSGVTLANSQSNSSVSFQDRIFNLAGAPRSISVLGASGCVVEGVIIEGAAMQYGIYFSSLSSSVATGFTVKNAHIEVASTRASIYLNPSGGIYHLEGLFQQLADTLIAVERQSGNPVINVYRIQNVTVSKFTNNSASNFWYFRDMQQSWDYNTSFVVAGAYVLPPVVNEDAGGSKKGTSVGMFSGSFGIAVGGSNISVAGNMYSTPTNTYSWGLQSLRPANFYGGNVHALNTGKFAFLGTTGSDVMSLTSPATQVLSINGTGATVQAKGTTAERPTIITGMVRWNTSTLTMEYAHTSTWKTFATTQDVIDSAAALRTAIGSGSGFVPYTGATSDVNIGSFNLQGNTLKAWGDNSTTGGALSFKQFGTVGSTGTGTTSIFALGANQVYLSHGIASGNTKQAVLDVSAIPANTTNTYEWPAASGRLATTADIISGTGQTEITAFPVDANYTIASATAPITVVYYSTMTADRTLTLPAATVDLNRVITITNAGAGGKTVLLSPSVYQNDAVAFTGIAPGGWVQVVSIGTKWVIRAKN